MRLPKILVLTHHKVELHAGEGDARAVGALRVQVIVDTSTFPSTGESVLGYWVGARRPFHAFLVPQRVPHGFTPRS